MAIAEVTTQRATAEGLSASATATFPATPTNGNLILAAISARGQATGTGIPTPPSGWATAHSRRNGANNLTVLFWKIAGASEPTAPAFTLTDNDQWVIALAQYSGTSSSPVDVVIDNGATTGTANTTGALPALAGAGELVVTLWTNINIYTWSAHDNSLAEIQEITSTGGLASARVNQSMATVLPSGTGSITYGATLSTSANWNALAVAFKPASGAMTGSMGGTLSFSGTLAGAGALSGDIPATFNFVGISYAQMTGQMDSTFAFSGTITPLYLLTGAITSTFIFNGRFIYGGDKFRQMWNAMYDKKSKLIAKIYAKTKALAEASVNVLNPSFENDQTGWTLGSGWNVVTAASVSMTAPDGTFLAVKNSGSADTQMYNAGRYHCSVGKRIKATFMARTSSGTGSGNAQLLWYDQAGTLLSTDNGLLTAAATVSGTWKTIEVNAVAPTSAAWVCIGMRVSGYTTGTWAFDKCTIETIVTNQTDMPPINSGNVGWIWTGLSITYTPGAGTSTTHTINVSAATLQMGDVSVSYNASSVNVTQARSTTQTWWLYYIDANYTGGTKTLNATTSGPTVTSNNSYVWIGEVSLVIPASGGSTGSGTGGGGGCVAIESYLPGDINQAQFIRNGDMMMLAEPTTLSSAEGMVTFSERKLEPCYRIVTSRLVTLICSRSAPIPVKSGGYRNPTELMGHVVPVMVDGIKDWDVIADIQYLGSMYVQHITVGDRCFWAGENKDQYILHHNVKAEPPY